MLNEFNEESENGSGAVDKKELMNLSEDITRLLSARFGDKFCTKNKGGFVLLLVDEKAEKEGINLVSNYSPSTCPHCLDVLHSTISPLHEQLDKMKDDLREMN